MRTRTNKTVAMTRLYLENVVMNYDGDACLTWPFSKSSDGYARFYAKTGSQLVTRIICEKEHGPPPTPKHQAAHSCGKGHLGCVAKGHLSWKTRKENFADKLLHGTDNRGEKHPLVKLSEADVRHIRTLKGTMYQREIANKFGVALTTVSGILMGRSWGHIA
jgi:hypothetical protein